MQFNISNMPTKQVARHVPRNAEVKVKRVDGQVYLLSASQREIRKLKRD